MINLVLVFSLFNYDKQDVSQFPYNISIAYSKDKME